MVENCLVTIAFRLLGWLELTELLCHWKSSSRHNRLSAFGVIGTWKANQNWTTFQKSHNRLSAFGVIGTWKLNYKAKELISVTIAFRLLGWLELYIARTGAIRLNIRHNRLSAFGVIGTTIDFSISIYKYCSHNRLSAFGVIGTKYFSNACNQNI